MIGSPQVLLAAKIQLKDFMSPPRLILRNGGGKPAKSYGIMGEKVPIPLRFKQYRLLILKPSLPHLIAEKGTSGLNIHRRQENITRSKPLPGFEVPKGESATILVQEMGPITPNNDALDNPFASQFISQTLIIQET